MTGLDSTQIRVSKLKKWGIPGLVLACFAYFYFSANPPGYCEAEKRVIPTDELCTSLFDGAIAGGKLQLDASESSGRQYYENHRNYCSVDRSAMGRFRREGLFTALFWDGIHANLTYKMTEEKKRYHPKSTLWDEWIALTPCGNIINISGIEHD